MTFTDQTQTSNTCDLWCLGPLPPVRLLGPLLQKLSENPHATLVTLFMNAVIDAGVDATPTLRADLNVLPRYPKIRSMKKIDEMLAVSALYLAAPPGRDVESIFARYVWESSFIDILLTGSRYMEREGFGPLTHYAGMMMKNRHTIIEKWPTRLKLTPGQPGADEEMDVVLRSCRSYMERYVEWARAE